MKKLANYLLKQIEECKELTPLLKHELMEFIIMMSNVQLAVKTSYAFIFNTRFITPVELDMNDAGFIKYILGYADEEKPNFSFDDFLSSIHYDDIAEFNMMMNDFYNSKSTCTSGLFRLMNKSGDYIWLYGRACLAGFDTMTDKPMISGFLFEVCYKFSTPHKLEILNREYLKLKTANNKHNFTLKDINIVKLMIEGLTIDEIAEKLKISVSNLNYRKTKMFIITNTNNASALTNYFILHGLI